MTPIIYVTAKNNVFLWTNQIDYDWWKQFSIGSYKCDYIIMKWFSVSEGFFQKKKALPFFWNISSPNVQKISIFDA